MPRIGQFNFWLINTSLLIFELIHTSSFIYLFNCVLCQTKYKGINIIDIRFDTFGGSCNEFTDDQKIFLHSMLLETLSISQIAYNASMTSFKSYLPEIKLWLGFDENDVYFHKLLGDLIHGIGKIHYILKQSARFITFVNAVNCKEVQGFGAMHWLVDKYGKKEAILPVITTTSIKTVPWERCLYIYNVDNTEIGELCFGHVGLGM